MDELLKALERIGVSDELREMAQEEYSDDPDALTAFALGCLARYDDRHEYLA